MSATDRIKELTRPTGEEDLLTVQYPSPRLRIEPKQALATAAVALALVGGWAGWSLTRAPSADPFSATPSWDNVATETHVSEQVVVSVVGEVANPGLITLNQGARVADALHIAQPHPHADLVSLNHAQLLVDGQQIHVTAVGEAPPALPGPAGTGLISINSATAAELTALPGVGEATAAAIVSHRETHGPFTAPEGLMDVKGIGPAKFDALKDQIAL